MVRHKNLSTKEYLLIFFIILILSIIGVTIVLVQRQTKRPSSSLAQTAVPWSYPRKMKVIILRYFHPSSANNNPSQAKLITDTVQGQIRTASQFHGGSNPAATPAVEVEVVATYDAASGRPDPMPGNWEASYNAMLNPICDQIVTQNIDQVWMMADPTVDKATAGLEWVVSSKNITGTLMHPALPGAPSAPFCAGRRGFTVMFFDLSRPQPNLHAFGHYMEGLLHAVQGYELLFKRFMGVDYHYAGVDGVEIAGFPLSERCGNIHIPPNMTKGTGVSPETYQGYVYDKNNEVSSGCFNWNPDNTGARNQVNYTTWANIAFPTNSIDTKYYIWWLQNMPNINNGLRFSGIPLPNWWDFVVDIDNTISFYLNNTYWMNPQLFTIPQTGSSSYKEGLNGTSTIWTHPGGL